MDMETHIVNLLLILMGIDFIGMSIWLLLKYSHGYDAFFAILLMIQAIFLGVFLIFIGIDDYIIALKERMKKQKDGGELDGAYR